MQKTAPGYIPQMPAEAAPGYTPFMPESAPGHTPQIPETAPVSPLKCQKGSWFTP
jgi:hypothetical protein